MPATARATTVNQTRASVHVAGSARALGMPNASMPGRYGKWTWVATGRSASGPSRYSAT